MSLIPHFLLKDAIVAKPGFNRWLVPPASIAIHLCIGSVYAWSIFNPPLTRELGVVAGAAGDWSLTSVTWVFSVAIAFLGLSAAIAGKWLERVGPRCVGTTAALCWGGGFVLGSLGVETHQLWLIYLGYGVIGGCGLGLGYVSPVSTLIRWFPDRRGMATGMAIMGFGGGAILGVPVKEALLKHYFQAPRYLGASEQVQMLTEGGRRFVNEAGQKIEVVVATAKEVKALPVKDLAEGVYAVGTGNTGAAATFLTLGLAYFLVMMIAAFCYRVPAVGWRPEGWTPPAPGSTGKKMITHANVDIDRALHTPQFYLLWIVLCFNVTAGIGVLSVAKTMIAEIFGSAMPSIVTPTFAATFVLMISVFNMVGRFLWASASDHLGRKRTYTLFFVLGAALYASIPMTAMRGIETHAAFWLYAFYAVSMVIFTMYGGGFATIPAYLADLFGTKFVGGIHGRLLTAWSVAGVAGPLAINSLRDSAVTKAVSSLASKIDPAVFEKSFGAPVSQLASLVSAKTVTIPKLMEIVPPGTPDPTPGLYNATMYSMAALLVVALVANLLVRPVAEDHHLDEKEGERHA